MKTFLTIALIALADALLVLAALLFVAGYHWYAAGLGAYTLAGVALAAWASRSRPAPAAPKTPCGVAGCQLPHCICCGKHPDPVDAHAAQMIRALSGQPAVLPEQHLLFPPRPQRGPGNPKPLGRQ